MSNHESCPRTEHEPVSLLCRLADTHYGKLHVCLIVPDIDTLRQSCNEKVQRTFAKCRFDRFSFRSGELEKFIEPSFSLTVPHQLKLQQLLAALPPVPGPSSRLQQSGLTSNAPSFCRSSILSPLQESWPLPLLWTVVAFRLEVTVAVRRPFLSFPFPLPLGVAPSCIGAGCELMYCCVRETSWISSRVLIQLSNRAVLRMRCSLTRESPKMTTPILSSSSTVSATGPRSHAPDVQTKRALHKSHHRTGRICSNNPTYPLNYELAPRLKSLVDSSAVALVPCHVCGQPDEDVVQLCTERGFGESTSGV